MSRVCSPLCDIEGFEINSLSWCRLLLARLQKLVAVNSSGITRLSTQAGACVMVRKLFVISVITRGIQRTCTCRCKIITYYTLIFQIIALCFAVMFGGCAPTNPWSSQKQSDYATSTGNNDVIDSIEKVTVLCI